MSATPIPRTMALGGYGGDDDGGDGDVLVGALDVSTLVTKPEGAREVQTSVVEMGKVGDVIEGVKRQVARGAKVFWVLPLIGAETDDLALSEKEREKEGGESGQK